MSKIAKTVPTLPKGNDAAVAEQLHKLVTEANDGLRRILAAGFFIECIAGELRHGQLGPWLEAHCPHVDERTVRRWRDLARNVAEAAKVKTDTMSVLDGPWTGGNFLTLPTEELPNELSEARARIDDVINGKTAKQLCLEFKQFEDGKVKVGRLKGQGGREADRPATPSELLEHEQHCATRDCHQVWLLLDHLAPRVPVLGETDMTATIAIFERWVTHLKEWERTPINRRTAEAGKALTLALKP